jgi:MFS family permease
MASDQAVTAAAPDAAPEEPQGGVLTNRDFCKLYAGESVSLMGTFITSIAMPLTAILTLHATVFEVGLLNVFRLSPVIVVALFAGVWLDRVKRRPVLICCSLGCAASIGLVPIAHTFGFLSLGLIYVVVAVAGALNVIFDVGALSYLPNLVEKRHLLEANGKMQAARATGAIAGPAIAGLLIGVLTAPITLSADAISYLFSAAGLSSIRRPEPEPEVPADRPPLRAQLAEGFRAVYSGPLVRSLLTISAALNLGFGAFWTIFLVYAVEVLKLSPFKLGIVIAAAAVGALLAALNSHRLREAFGYGQVMIYGVVGMSTVLLLLLIPRNADLTSMIILVIGQFVYGACITNFNVNAITLRQMVTPKRLLARMNATYRLMIFGVPPLGALAGGLLGSAVGLRTALMVSLIAMTTPLLWLPVSPVFRVREMPTMPPEDQVPGPAAAGVATAKEGADD